MPSPIEILDLRDESETFDLLKARYFDQICVKFEGIVKNLLLKNSHVPLISLFPWVSRSQYINPLFNQIAKSIIIDRYTEGNRGIQKILLSLDDVELMKISAIKNSRDLKFICTEKSKNSSFGIDLKWIGTLAHLLCLRLISLIKCSPRKGQNIIFVDLFVVPKMIKEDYSLVDRYFNFFKGANKEFKDKVVYIPNLTGFRFREYIRYIRFVLTNKAISIESPWNYLTPITFLKVFLTLRGLKREIHLGPLEKEPLLKDYLIRSVRTNQFSLFNWKTFLSYHAYKALFSKNKAETESILDWHENQPIDRALSLAASHAGVFSKVTGYHGGTVIYSRDFHFKPQKYECELKVCPTKIAVLGERFGEELHQLPYINVSVIPAFRFSYLWENSSRINCSTIRNKIVLLLPYYVDSCRTMIDHVFEHLPENLHSKVVLKPHPITEPEIRTYYPHLNFSDLNASELVHEKNIYIGYLGTSLIFECLAMGSLVIMINLYGHMNLSSFESIDSFKVVKSYSELGRRISEFIEQKRIDENSHNLEDFFMSPTDQSFCQI